MNYLFLFQLLTHLSVAVMLYYGNWYHYLIAFFVYFLTGCFGMTVTYHRLLAHKSFIPKKYFEYIGTLLATIGGTGSSIAWVAVHREHHRFTDTPKDPHSPQHKGILWVQFLSMFHKPKVKYVPDLLRSNFHLNVHRYYWGVHLIYATLLLVLFGPFAIVYAHLFPSFILWHAGSFINTLGHSNSKDPKMTAANHWLLGLLVWGEGFHRNHHDDAKSSSFSTKPYQIDIGGFFIKRVLSQ